MYLLEESCDSHSLCLQTSLSIFSRDEVSVKRRFSDFLGLHSKLASKYMHIGYIVPPAPEKSIVGKSVQESSETCSDGVRFMMKRVCFSGMTKVKVGKEDLSSVEFVEKRRSALERYSN